MENPTGMENPTPDEPKNPTPDEPTEGAADVTLANDEAAAYTAKILQKAPHARSVWKPRNIRPLSQEHSRAHVNFPSAFIGGGFRNVRRC